MRAVMIMIIGFMLVGCSTNLQNPTSLPPLIEYSDDFRDDFANELDTICGKQDFPKACLFIQDSIELRSSIRAVQDK